MQIRLTRLPVGYTLSPNKIFGVSRWSRVLEAATAECSNPSHYLQGQHYPSIDAHYVDPDGLEYNVILYMCEVVEVSLGSPSQLQIICSHFSMHPLNLVRDEKT